MEKITRIIWLATCYGLIGIVYGAATGAIVGVVMGLIFGGVKDGIAFGVWYGVILDGVTFAWTAVLWDDGPGTHFFGWRNPMSKPAVLFLCTNNAVRSQMAEALLKKRAAEHFDAYSAGTEPKEIHPLAIQVMSEIGIDLSGQRPKDLRQYLGKLPVRVAIFVCRKAEEKCPTLWPGALTRLEWPFDDPAAVEGNEEERIAKFRFVRDQIDQKITTWLTDLSAAR